MESAARAVKAGAPAGAKGSPHERLADVGEASEASGMTIRPTPADVRPPTVVAVTGEVAIHPALLVDGMPARRSSRAPRVI